MTPQDPVPESAQPVTERPDDAAEWTILPVAQWQPTRDTLHLWTQIIGKIRLANSPLVNHWWNVPLYVTSRGLTTSLIPHNSGRNFQIDFDFQAHQLQITTSDGQLRSLSLEPRTVADFYNRVLNHLNDLGLTTRIWPMPVEIENAIPFDNDDTHASYDRDHVQRYWRTLVQIDRVMHKFRSRFLGKASPVHLWWGALDLATSRFSGRPAPPHPSSAPNLGPHVMLEAYSYEVSSCGYWPDRDHGLFYSYIYPEPDGFRDAPVEPDGAYYSEELGEFVLPYEPIRESANPENLLLDFLQTTYEAAAEHAGWQRSTLERTT
ncbi:DUF5996 family protein [Pseudonocardia xinjiangensis]|uniref:DUF5996 family protein n=1 Tax=Pseudonocardia xinjiangensis TaxID=75289 RepID=UPI003D94B2EF